MADSVITIGSTGMKKKVVDLGDGTYADAVVEAAPAHADEVILAGPSSEMGSSAERRMRFTFCVAISRRTCNSGLIGLCSLRARRIVCTSEAER